MEGILKVFLAFALLLVGLSIVMSVALWPFTGGKLDPWLILRFMSKIAARVTMRSLRGTMNLLSAWSGATWRRAQRRGTAAWARIVLYVLSFLLGSVYFLLAIPVEIIGSAPKVK